MKIGVVTYWYGNSNYGMIMQCWAFQQYLKKMGHEPYVIRYQPERPWYIRFAKWCLKYLMCVFSSNQRAVLKQEKYNAIKDKDRGFDDFRKTYLDFSERFYKNIGELRKNPPVADCYIAGSDQIWCYDVSFDENGKGYYLDFGSENTKRVAYAPSFGRLIYNDNNIGALSRALSKFDSVSCREQRGVEMCKKAGIVAQHVFDPTLLLAKEEYESLCNHKAKDDYFFIYSVNIGKAEDVYWDRLKEYFPNKKIVVTPASGSITGGEIFGEEVIYNYATPEEWLSLIKNAEMVITSSFHGVVFSIIFNKRFAFIPIKGAFESTNNRILDLLKSLDLESLIINKPDDYKEIQSMVIDWAMVNNKRINLIEESISFLENALKD